MANGIEVDYVAVEVVRNYVALLISNVPQCLLIRILKCKCSYDANFNLIFRTCLQLAVVSIWSLESFDRV